MVQRVYQNQGAQAKTRRANLSPQLVKLLTAVGEKVGVYLDVYSGGQNEETGYKGSVRHDHGNAADLKVFLINADGSRHYLNQADADDLSIWKDVVKYSAAYGATGIGAAEYYMGNDSMHIGFNNPDRTGPHAKKGSTYVGTWGDDGHRANAPQWLKESFAEGRGMMTTIPASSFSDMGVPRPRPASLSAPSSSSATVLDASFGVPNAAASPSFGEFEGGSWATNARGLGALPDDRTAGLIRPQNATSPLLGGAGRIGPFAAPLGSGAVNGSNTQVAGSASLTPTTSLSDWLSTAAMNGVNDPGAAPDFTPGINVVSGGGGLLSNGSPLSALAAPARDLATSGALGQQTSASAGAALGPAASTAVAPVPVSRPIAAQVAPTPFQRPVQAASASAVAPTPMPGRPADTAPTRTAATAGPALVRLASGEMIAVGTYPSNDGTHAVQITDDGTGKAKITKILSPGEIPGVINPLREVNSNTVAGGVIRSMLPDAIGSGVESARSSLVNAAQNIPNANAAVDAAQSLGSSAGSAVGALGNTLSSAFGTMGSVFAPRNDNSSSSSTATLQSIHDRNEDRVVAASTPALGSTSTGATALGAAAAPITTYRTQTNPAFTDWQQQYGDVTVQPLAITRLQDIHDREDDRRIAASTPSIVASVPAAPARTIQVAVQSSGGGSSGGSSSGGSSSGGSSTAAAAPQTFQGTSTGRTYVVGNTYANGNGTYVAQPDGSFQRISSGAE